MGGIQLSQCCRAKTRGQFTFYLQSHRGFWYLIELRSLKRWADPGAFEPGIPQGLAIHVCGIGTYSWATGTYVWSSRL